MNGSTALAIKKAQHVVTQYIANNSGTTPHPIGVLSAMPMGVDYETDSDGIVNVIGQLFDTKISVFRVTGLPESVNAYILRYEKPNRARIVYSSTLNLCWSRLLICKEASHIFLADENNKTSTADDAIKLIGNLLNDVNPNSPELKVEEDAYYAAIELMLPQQHIAAVQEMSENGLSNLDIAKSFKIPERIIEFRLNPDINTLYEHAYNS